MNDIITKNGMVPDPYQVHAVNLIAGQMGKGVHSILLQLATGGGKTVIFSLMCHRYLQKQQKKIVILVHRQELVGQTCRTLYEWFGIIAVPVTADRPKLQPAMVYVAMVETAHNRLKKNKDYFGNVGLLIVDECHVANFKKLFSYFPWPCFRTGFTATPIAADKTDPLKNHYAGIITVIDIPELIKMNKVNPKRGLVQNITHDYENVIRTDLKEKGDDFDEQQMGVVFRSPKYVKNTVLAYERFCKGKKTIIFNVNIEHSKEVTAEFIRQGYKNVYHLDGEMPDHERKAVLYKFRNTPGSIMNNVGVLTTGYDDASILAGIFNCATKSIPKLLQCAGRCGRPFPGKEVWPFVDMGGNAAALGDWSASRDWIKIFKDPDIIYDKKKKLPPPSKTCHKCRVVIPARMYVCPHCGFSHKQEQVYDEMPVTLNQLIIDKPLPISVVGLIREFAEKRKVGGDHYKEIAVLHHIKFRLIQHAQRVWKIKQLNDQTAGRLIKIFQEYCLQWCTQKEKMNEWHQWMKNRSRSWMIDEFKNIWKWKPINERSNQKV